MAKALAQANGWWLVAALLFFNLSKIVSALRLNLYFSQMKLALSTIDNLKLYYLGMFYNLFLPGGIGGDGYKIWLLHKRYHAPVKRLMMATLLDRVSGFVALVVFACLLWPFSRLSLYIPFAWMAPGIALIVSLGFWWGHQRFFALFHPVFFQTSLLGAAVQLLQLCCAGMILVALGCDHLSDYLLLFLISSVLATLPLSVGGIGIRELTLLYGAGILGDKGVEAVLFSLLFFTITALSSLVGLFFQGEYR